MFNRSILFSAVALALGTLAVHAQTVTTTTTTTTSTDVVAPTSTVVVAPPTTTTTTTPTTTITATPLVVTTITPAPGEAQYLGRVGTRFDGLAGTDTNLQSLVHGLRTGSEVQLVGPSGTTADSVIFTPTTRPMGYGNITRALDLAMRQLAAAGITNPTPQQLNAALNGGTITTAQGTTTFDGILTLRSQGMGWGKIAQTIGVHPGMGKMPTTTSSTAAVGTTTTTASGTTTTTTKGPTKTTTAAGTTTSGGVTTAAGPGASTTSGKSSGAGKGLVTAAGTGAAGVQSGPKGITTAAGSISGHGGGSSGAVQPGSGMVTGAGVASSSSGITTAGGGAGHGNAYGRSK